MRLIDADAMLERLQEWNTSDDMDKALYRFTLDRIIEQPTAFDVDKVAAQLDREKFVESEITLSDVHQGYNAGLSRAIEIVKRYGTKLIYQTNLKEETENDKWRIDS